MRAQREMQKLREPQPLLPLTREAILNVGEATIRGALPGSLTGGVLGGN